MSIAAAVLAGFAAAVIALVPTWLIFPELYTAGSRLPAPAASAKKVNSVTTLRKRVLHSSDCAVPRPALSVPYAPAATTSHTP